MRTRTASLAFAIVAASRSWRGRRRQVVDAVSITLDVNFDNGTEIITDQTNFCDGTAESSPGSAAAAGTRWARSCSTSQGVHCARWLDA